MVYLTGDTHGDFGNIIYFSKVKKTRIKDVMIILGDAGVNYHLNERDEKKKKKLATLNLTLLCIHGNHEQRPTEISSYRKKRWHGGVVYVEPEYPNILFAKDGEVYRFGRIKAMAIGGAYSVDKWYRLSKGWTWFDNEQPSEIVKRRVESKLQKMNWTIDVILSHTVPLKYEPVEVFLSVIPQDTVDKTTETWLDYIEDMTDYSKWYCGHYHTKKCIDKLQMMYDDIIKLSVDKPSECENNAEKTNLSDKP